MNELSPETATRPYQTCNRSLHVFLLLVFTCLVVHPVNAAVILTEIMYNPDGPDYYTEYIECYNTGTGVIDLHGWMIGDGDEADTLITPPDRSTSMLLRPGHYALILDAGYWENGESLYDDFIPADALLLTVSDAAIGSGGLGNSTPETVQLFDAFGDVVSQRTYRIGAEQGCSEECILLNGDSSNANWTFSDFGGSPGYENTVSLPDFDLAVDSLRLSINRSENDAAYDLIIEGGIRNTGLQVAQSTQLALYMDRHRRGHWELAGDWTVPALDFGYVYPVDARLEQVPGGRLDVQIRLVTTDDDTTNNVACAFVHVPFEAGVVRFSELMPAPPEEIAVEWFELLNSSNESNLPLAGWTITDESGRIASLDSILNINPVFGEDGSWKYLVVAQNETILNWPGIDAARVVIPESWPSLNDDGDVLTLSDPTGQRIDIAEYSEAESGISFIRRDWHEKPYPGDWIVISDPTEASPGEPNRISPYEPGTSPEVVEAGAPVLSISPNPFSPDGDGREDEVLFHFGVASEQIEVTLRLFDVNGRRLATLMRSTVLPGNGVWSWDGRVDGYGYLPAGIYVYHAEIRDANGSGKWETKGTLVSARK